MSNFERPVPLTDEDLKQRILAIPARNKTARLRSLLPVIESQMARGVSTSDIVQALREGGLDFTAATFRNYLARLRRQRAQATVQAPPLQGPTAADDRSPTSARAGQIATNMPSALLLRTDAFDQYERIGKALSGKRRPSG